MNFEDMPEPVSAAALPPDAEGPETLWNEVAERFETIDESLSEAIEILAELVAAGEYPAGGLLAADLRETASVFARCVNLLAHQQGKAHAPRGFIEPDTGERSC